MPDFEKTESAPTPDKGHWTPEQAHYFNEYQKNKLAGMNDVMAEKTARKTLGIGEYEGENDTTENEDEVIENNEVA